MYIVSNADYTTIYYRINLYSLIPIMTIYEIIEGCRKVSFIYVNEGYTYRKDKDVKGI